MKQIAGYRLQITDYRENFKRVWIFHVCFVFNISYHIETLLSSLLDVFYHTSVLFFTVCASSHRPSSNGTPTRADALAISSGTAEKRWNQVVDVRCRRTSAWTGAWRVCARIADAEGA